MLSPLSPLFFNPCFFSILDKSSNYKPIKTLKVKKGAPKHFYQSEFILDDSELELELELEHQHDPPIKDLKLVDSNLSKRAKPVFESKNDDFNDIKPLSDQLIKNQKILATFQDIPWRPVPLSSTLSEFIQPLENSDIPVDQQKSQTVSIIGAPNVGKSTLVNALCGQDLSISSPRAQTTRDQVSLIFQQKESQIVFIDTPGIVNRSDEKRIFRSLVQAAFDSTYIADTICVVVDPKSSRIPKDVETMLYRLRNSFQPKKLEINKNDQYMKSRAQFGHVVGVQDFGLEEKSESLSINNAPNFLLIFNKMDTLDTNSPQQQAALFQTKTKLEKILRPLEFESTYLTSALKNVGVDKISNYLIETCHQRSWLYPPGTTIDQSELEFVSEKIREQLYRNLSQELAYFCQQENLDWTQLPNGSLRIVQRINVPRSMYAKALIGKKGQRLYSMIENVLDPIKRFLNQDVVLSLEVKVKKGIDSF